MRFKLVFTHDELARILFGADLGPRWAAPRIRDEVQARILTWGVPECLRRHKRYVRQAAEAGELREHFRQLAWYRTKVIRAYPVRPPRPPRPRPAAVGRTLLEVLSADGDSPG